MQFAHPGWLWLLVLSPLPLLLERARGRLGWPILGGFAVRPHAGGRGAGRVGSARLGLRFIPGSLRGLAIGAMGLALARPQTVGGVERIAGQGVAIVVALDQSSSMKTEDFPADRDTRRIGRLEAAKATLLRFVEGRPDDMVGLVLFANYPDLACPPELDHRFLVETIPTISVARPGDDGTNIGDAIAWSLDALRITPPRRKVLVLMTDGNNQPAGRRPLDPERAADLARQLGVTIHTIAIGRPGGVVRDADAETGQPILAEVEGPNLRLLETVAEVAGGRSFIAADADALDRVFGEINRLEKSLVKSRILTRYDEHFATWAAAAAAFLSLERLLASTWLRRTP
ncbi:von Willebrand factor type A domain protein [Aquisphaera giovannonii]|uniref:von Willebrand factor type A domain protein n=1 Tax=Aquisphaera giovannonii TaxID=406548 RepID=A0A5B9VZ68_9BACT|nr:VWA domain-containing protein [Aquisphaera giovannonii]QEH33234.1 von Willebrand factor type A domain protein [Aquisphaera giovannonii]